LLLGLAAIITLFTIVWVISVRLENSSVADVAWGPGILLIGITYYFTGDGYPLRAQLTLVLLTIWAIRLAVHLGMRVRNEGEDRRYVARRDEREDSWWWFSYFKVFLLQAVLAWLVSAPLYFATVSLLPRALTVFDILGVMLFTIGIVFEAVGDEQLRRFRGDKINRGRVLDTGLWRYTRHPNYFGEVMVWWGFGFIALATGGFVGLFGPAILTYLLLYVSGVPMLEATLIEKKAGYARYVGRTPAFLPIPAQWLSMEKLKRK
jgi:steroid 5-alpha reductase family enzyme